MQQHHKKTLSLGKGIARSILLLYTVIVAYPLIWNVLASLKTSAEVLKSPWAFPSGFHWPNYVNAFTKAKMGAYILNSVMITFVSLAILIVIATPTAYALSRFQFRGRAILQNIYLAGLFIQPIFIMIPLFLLLNKMGMLDNRFYLSLIYATGSLPFSIYLLSGFLKSIPREYEQAAAIDGCGYFSTLFRIIVPMAKPGMITLIIFNFFTFWNEYVLALIFISSDEKKTIPIGLANLMEVQRYATDWGALFAGLVLILVPTVTLYALTQKKLTDGMMLGGLKG